MKEARKLKCWTCNTTTMHYILHEEKIYECNICGGLRKVDGSESLGELMGLSKGVKDE